MSRFGFQLRRLTLLGSDVPDAEILFRSGLNVISGPSDTGKTYIAQCLDFMFGAKSPPKRIPEARLYDRVHLAIVPNNGDPEVVLQRSLQGGEFVLRSPEQGDRTLSARHGSGEGAGLSEYLLGLSGLASRSVRKNKDGVTQALSFRNVSRLILVDEESVISERSPIHSGRPVERTLESSVFRMLLSGIGDSSVVAKGDPKVARGRREGKTEILEELLARLRTQSEEQRNGHDEAGLRAALDEIESQYERVSAELDAERESVADLEGTRRDGWTRLREIESRRSVLVELEKRFRLLDEQYASDLKRLEAIAEAGLRLGQMPEERCPVCGALAENHAEEHKNPGSGPEDVAVACQAEAEKIRGLRRDLEGALSDISEELGQLTAERASVRSKLESIGNEIAERLEPRLANALRKLRESEGRRDQLRSAVDLYERIDELEQLLEEAEVRPVSESGVISPKGVGADESEGFSVEVESLLREWHFPDLDRVVFGEESQDLVISGEERASHGKGVRAITHAAFNLGLLRYCAREALPHPGLVIVDSPLVVFREPDAEEKNFSPQVKDWFYRSLAEGSDELQVVILENEDPPVDVEGIANVVRFTGADHGRPGFVPR